MVIDARRAITLGHPSYVWRSGQERRLNLIRRYARLDGRQVLDIGCGLGAYVANFRRFTPYAYGMDVDAPRVHEGRRRGVDNLLLAAAETLPFKDGSFDVIVLNEVIEHVQDDAATLREACRVLRPGGEVLPGVYAAGEVAGFGGGGMHGYNALEGTFLGGCIFSGRAAGRAIACR